MRTSFWDVALAEMEALRQQSALGQSAVQPATLGRVDKILSLVPHLIPQVRPLVEQSLLFCLFFFQTSNVY